VQWWRIAKLLKTRRVRLDTGNVADATQIVAAGMGRAELPLNCR
jgi:hypothetical protein